MKEERVFLYNFTDEERKNRLVALLRSIGIGVRSLPDEAWREKIGYLLGKKGFIPVREQEEEFCFPHEVMLLENIRNKRLDQVLVSIKEAGLSPVAYKVVITPFNTLWTLKRLCLTLEKEHGGLLER